MSTSAVISALQTRHAALSGVTSAPTALPASLNSVDLPCALVFPGQGQHLNRRVSERTTQRVYLVRVYVAPIAQGQGVDEGFQDTITLLDTFSASYEQNRAIGSAAKIYGDFTDSGHVIAEFAGIAYHAFEFTLPVVEL